MVFSPLLRVWGEFGWFFGGFWGGSYPKTLVWGVGSRVFLVVFSPLLRVWGGVGSRTFGWFLDGFSHLLEVLVVLLEVLLWSWFSCGVGGVGRGFSSGFGGGLRF